MLCPPLTLCQENENTRYVSDVLLINIKDRLDKPYEVVTVVQSDDPVRIVEESGNYYKIITAEGQQGWIAKQYLKSEPPKSLLVKQLNEEILQLKSQLASQPAPSFDSTKAGENQHNDSFCQELQQKLNDAEKYITKLEEEQKDQLQKISEASHLSPSTPEDYYGAIDNAEYSPENYSLLITEYEKRGKQLDELKKTLAKKEDNTRFLWFAAGAAVFLIGVLAGKGGTRKKE